MIEMHQLPREADDLVFQQLQPIAHVHLAQGFAFQANELAASLVDGIDLLLQPAGPGRVPHHCHYLHHLPGGIDYRRADHFHELLIFDIQRVSLGTAEVGGSVGGLRGNLLAEDLE